MNPDEWKLIDRFKEPSSWSALATGAALVGVSIPSSWMQVVAFVGSGVCIALGILLKEQPHA